MSKYRGARQGGGNYVTVIVPAELDDDFIVMDARSHRPNLLPAQHLSYLLLFIIIQNHSKVRPRITVSTYRRAGYYINDRLTLRGS